VGKLQAFLLTNHDMCSAEIEAFKVLSEAIEKKIFDDVNKNSKPLKMTDISR